MPRDPPRPAPEITVIVPLHRYTDAARRCVESVLSAGDPRVELVVVSDHPQPGLPRAAQLLLTGASSDTSPAEKRDAALAHARGHICAFLDDDAYPAPQWIDRALRRFEDPTVAALGGPGVTPPQSGWRARAGGEFYESPFGSGSLRYRFRPQGGVRDVDDFPAYNFFVRTEVLRGIGGWGSRLYGGEDTFVCLSLVERGHRIVYDPEVLVFHHRRDVFRPHLRQVANVGRHRGNFVRRYPRTSARPIYFAPSAALLTGAAALPWVARRRARAASLMALIAAGWLTATVWALGDRRDPAVAVALPAVVAASHAAYGAAFLRGLFGRAIHSM